MSRISIICVSVLLLSGSIFAQSKAEICPVVQITASDSEINPGETMTFFVKIEDEKIAQNLKYKWAVSAGTIVEGQNTSIIKFETTPEMQNSTATAKVILQGLSINCLNRASQNVKIARMVACDWAEDYGKILTESEKSKLNNVFTLLANNPESTAFFRLIVERGESIEQTKSRIGRILQLAVLREVDKKRFVFAIDKSRVCPQLTTNLMIFGDEKFVECKNCEIIKGEDVK